MKPVYFIFCLTIITTIIGCYGKNGSFVENKYFILNPADKLSVYVRNYFKLSEDRNVETWYKTYLSKCTTFYNIQKPSKDSILNLIKSYWVTSSNQKHEITTIEGKNNGSGREILITMKYSYFHIPSNKTKVINNLKLFMVLDKRRNVVFIKEFSRG